MTFFSLAKLFLFVQNNINTDETIVNEDNDEESADEEEEQEVCVLTDESCTKIKRLELYHVLLETQHVNKKARKE